MKTWLAFLLSLMAAAPALAATLVDVQVLDRTTGQTLETWSHRGRLYVVGTPGNRYAISLRNRSSERVLTVLSVDGVNAVSGQTAAATQSGYVVAPGQNAEIAGWRKNLDEVAAFYFTSVSDSYAGRSGRPQNVGVIGVAVFREYAPPPLRPQPWLNQRDLSDAPAAAAAPSGRMETQKSRAAEERLGTGHGERLDARVDSTEFRRASSAPAEIVSIYYDSRANLEARGIIPSAPVWPRPQPFPGGFVADPRG